jgi:TolB-like protein
MIGPDDEVTLLDFGIARLIRSDTGGPTENTLAKMVGFTSAYAVPEVMLGSNPTRASDIFQIGLVGYQLATGKNYWAVQIEQRSERLSDAVLGSKLKESLAKALAWDVTKRHPSAVEFLADLGNCGRRSLISIFTGKRVCIGGLLMVILGVLLTLYLANWGARAQQDSLPVVQTQPAPPLSANPRVAVLYFKNHSLDVNTLTSLSKGLCSMVITDLDHRSDYDLVERTRIQEVLRELEMTSGGAFDKSATAKIGKLVGAEYLLFGSFFLAVEKFRMDARLVEVERGIVVASAGVTGKSSEFDVLAFRLVEMILAEHHHGRHTVAAARSTDLTDVGVDLDCAARFGLALDHRDKGRKSEALETLDSVVRMNPQFDNARNLLVKWRATDKADPAADRKSTPIPKGESIDQSP